LGEQFVLPSLLLQNHLPELIWLAIEDEFHRRFVRKPRFAFYFILQLAGAPSGVTSEHSDFSRR